MFEKEKERLLKLPINEIVEECINAKIELIDKEDIKGTDTDWECAYLDLQEEYREYKECIEDMTLELFTSKKQIKDLTVLYDKILEENHTLEVDKDFYEEELVKLRENYEEYKKICLEQREEMDEQEEEIDNLKLDIHKVKLYVESLESTIKLKDKVIKDYSDELLNNKYLKKEIKEVKDIFRVVKSENRKLRKAQDTKYMQNLEREVSRYKAYYKELKENCKKQDKLIALYEDNLESNDKVIKELNETINNLLMEEIDEEI